MHILWEQPSLNSQVKYLNLSLSYWLVSFLSLNSLILCVYVCVCVCFNFVLTFVLNYSYYISLCYTSYCTTSFYFSLYNWPWIMFHPKHVLIKRYEIQKHRLVHQSDILLRSVTKPWYYYYYYYYDNDILDLIILLLLYQCWF